MSNDSILKIFKSSFDSKFSSNLNRSNHAQKLPYDTSLDFQQSSTSESGNIFKDIHSNDKDVNNSVTAGIISKTSSPPNGQEKKHALRSISGNWVESTRSKNSKSKKNFKETSQLKIPVSSKSIPMIPDLDDLNDNNVANKVEQSTSLSVKRISTFKELNLDLLAQDAFSANVQDVDLSILTKCLQQQDTLNEPDEVWEWEKLFTEVMTEISAEKPVILKNDESQLILAPDEIPPPSLTITS